MRTGTLVALAAIAVTGGLITWLSSRPGGAVGDAGAATPSRANTPGPLGAPPATDPPASPSERRSVQASTDAGPTGARVACVWADDGTPAVAMPVLAYRVENRAHVGPVASGTSDAAGVVTFAELVPGEHAFRSSGRVTARALVVAGAFVDVELRFTGSAVVAGIVVGAGEAPIPAAEVAAEIAHAAVSVATTDARGRFRARVPAPARIWARKDGFMPSRLHVIPESRDDVVLRLEAATASVRGIVVDPDRRPVPRAEVAIAIDDDPKGGSRQPPVLLETDASGAFATTQVPRAKLVVYARAEGFAFGLEDVDMSGEGTANVVVALRRGATVHGVVLGGTNGDEPQVGTPILVHRQWNLPGLLIGMSDRFTRDDTVTDATGNYRLTGLPPGRAWLVALTRKHVYRNVLLEEGDDHEWNPDVSPPSGVIRGVLHGPAGEPLVGWQVRANRTDLFDMAHEHATATTQDDGRFEVRELRPFPHVLTVTAPDSDVPIATRDGVQPDSTAFVWQLAALPSQNGTIVGRLLDADGAPISGTKLRAGNDGLWRNGEAAAASDCFRIAQVLPGTWHVTGQLKGYGSFDLGRHRVDPGATLDLGTHRLPALGSVLVRVTGSGREPPAGVHLTLEQIEGGANRTSGFTADGTALRSPALPPGLYRLQARGENFAPLVREVRIPPGATAECDLHGDRAAPVTIELAREDVGEGEVLDWISCEVRDAAGVVVAKHSQEVRGAATATLRIGLPAGAYAVEASSNQGAYRRGRTEFVVAPDAIQERRVRVLLEVQRR